MASFWQVIVRPRNRQTLSWVGGGIVALAAGAWSVVTYVWPAHESPTIACAQHASIVAGRDASGNTINYTGGATPGAGTVATPCAEARK